MNWHARDKGRDARDGAVYLGEASTSASYARTAATLGGQYRKFFGASVAAVLLLQVTVVTDTIIVGQLLGPVPMSGIRVASPIVNILNVLAMLVGVGGSTVAAIAIGRRDAAKANHAFTLSIVGSIVLGLLFAVAIVPFAEPLAQLISSDASTVPYTAAFLRIVAAASPVYILASVMAMLLRTDSCIKLSSSVLALAGVANVVFDLLFMGVLGMGVEGSALATDAGMLVAVLASLLYFRWPRRTLKLTRIAQGAQGQVSAIVKNGAPSALRMLFACIALLFLNYVVGDCVGVEGIAFLTVCGNVQLLAVAFFSAGGQAAIPLEGVLYGERDFHGLRLLMGYVVRVVLICVGVIAVVLWLFPAQVVGMFVPGGLPGTDWLLRLYSLGFLPLALNYVMTYYYNTIQQRAVSLTLTLLENLVLYLPLIWVLTHALGLVGAVLSFVLAETLALVVLVVLAQYLKRKLQVDNVLLIPNIPREVVFQATVPTSNADAAGIAHAVKGALDECGVDEAVALRTTMGVEEMVANAAASERNKGRDVLFDVIVSNLPACVQVSMRDNGAPFDPTCADVRDEGIAMMLAVASRVQHNQSLGMNQTIIEVEKTGVADEPLTDATDFTLNGAAEAPDKRVH